MIVAVAESDTEQALATLREQGENPWVIGHIAQAADGDEPVELQGL